jgi:hypothetical protein
MSAPLDMQFALPDLNAGEDADLRLLCVPTWEVHPPLRPAHKDPRAERAEAAGQLAFDTAEAAGQGRLF